MICRLCLINIESSEAIALYLSSIDNYPSIYINIMEKYLHLKIPPNDQVSMSLCLVCAKTLRDFDRFYLMVEEKQKTLEITSITIKDEPPNEIGCVVSNEYIQDQAEAIEEASPQLENKNDENVINTYEISNVEDEHMSQEPDIKIEEFRAPDPEQEKEFPPEPNEGFAISSEEMGVPIDQQLDPNMAFEAHSNPITLSTLLSLNEATSNDLWIPNCEADLIYSFIPSDIVLQDVQRTGLSKTTFKGLKRSSTERVRAWRQRQREKVNGIMSSSGPTFKGLKKSSTEKVRAWRQRQKEKMKANLSEAAPIHAIKISEVTFNNALNTANPNVRKSSAEKVREWRQRKKEKMKATLAEASMNANQISETNCCDTSSALIPIVKKSSAEKVRAWRQRQKEKLKASMNSNQISETTSNDASNTAIPNKKKTSAEKVREWRQRQKEKMKAKLSEAKIEVTEGSTSDTFTTDKTIPKSTSSPEKIKMESHCRIQKTEDNLSEGSGNAIQISNASSEPIISIKKSSAEKVRAWRQRKREKIKASLSEVNTNDVCNTAFENLRKSSTERVRAWRQRQREKNLARELLLQNITSNEYSSLKSPGRKLSSTERVRAWRQKQREKRNASIALTSAQCLEVLIKEENIIPSGGVQGWSEDQIIKPEHIGHNEHLDPYS